MPKRIPEPLAAALRTSTAFLRLPDLLRLQRLAALLEDEAGHIAVGVDLETELRLNDAHEEIGLALGIELDFGLPGNLMWDTRSSLARQRVDAAARIEATGLRDPSGRWTKAVRPKGQSTQVSRYYDDGNMGIM
jgi:hypothetical protein